MVSTVVINHSGKSSYWNSKSFIALLHREQVTHKSNHVWGVKKPSKSFVA